ncbi:hypothetical protein F8M41_003043 [Gigaspora margarita]|uniref:Uncharacterized protein n=1 Tax=Gigaspora margarita TaxID=4874 RepID=A0A8H3XDD0_GIGMA|nr:hypothetical protein F8M41_003043 [Gigaspora margarita]
MEGSKVSPDKNLHEEEEEVIARLIQDFNFGETSDNNNKDVTNEEAKTKKLFTDVEWSEMKSDFDQTVEFKEIDDKNDLCDLFDKIQEAINNEVDDIITNVEKCIIEGKPKINLIRRLITNYSYQLARLQSSVSEASFSNHFTNMISKGILTYDMKSIYDKRPTGSMKSKKWNDKVDMMVAIRDVLLRDGQDINGIECNHFKKLYTLGVHSYGFFYDVYAMDWKAKDLWRLDLIKRTKLPQSNKQLLMLEKLVITLLRVELTLNNIERIRNDLAIEAARLLLRGKFDVPYFYD